MEKLKTSIMITLITAAILVYAGCVPQVLEEDDPSPGLLINYPWNNVDIGADNFVRAFYITGYPGKSLTCVKLWLTTDTAGSYTVKLDAHSSTYDGALVGSASADFDSDDDIDTYNEVSFKFNNPAISKGSVVAFKMSKTSGSGEIFFNVNGNYGTGTIIVKETVDSTPPLSTLKTDGIAILVYGLK